MRNNRADNVRHTGDTLNADAPRANIAVFRPATAELPSSRAPVGRSQLLSLQLLHLSAAVSGSPPRSHAAGSDAFFPVRGRTNSCDAEPSPKVRAPVEPVSTYPDL